MPTGFHSGLPVFPDLFKKIARLAVLDFKIFIAFAQGLNAATQL